jgi:hypothetical protein
MERISKEHLKSFSDEEVMKMSIRSVSGCNIKVGDKTFNVYYDSKGEMVFDEFVCDFKLTETEFDLLVGK